ncbi:hypothetical protein KM043_006554 [Ampulex compressa]|nr:hypothetical protein KM043_006554 [Ampulex compressa]
MPQEILPCDPRGGHVATRGTRRTPRASINKGYQAPAFRFPAQVQAASIRIELARISRSRTYCTGLAPLPRGWYLFKGGVTVPGAAPTSASSSSRANRGHESAELDGNWRESRDRPAVRSQGTDCRAKRPWRTTRWNISV